MRIFVLVSVLFAGPALAQSPVIPIFAEETATAGITHEFTGEWQYMVGGGVAAFDCNDDGRQDLALAGGTAAAALFGNDSVTAGPLRFVRRTSGIERDGVTGLWPLDVDGDGITDLAMLRVGENLLMRGLGDCRFEPANPQWGFDGGDAWSTAFAATWEKGSVWPTLAVGNYIDRNEETFPWGSCTANWLHRGQAGTFAPPVALEPSHCALSMLFTDWNRSGTPSLRISNDREYYKGGREQLWSLQPGSDPVAYTDEQGWRPLRIWGMGIASYDLDFDGYPEYFLTSMADSKLQSLANSAEPVSPTYADIAFPRGVIAQRPYIGDDIRPSTGWHAQFEDVNNDGLADLFVAKGNVDSMPDFAQADPNNLLLQMADGNFAEAGAEAGIASMLTARGAALVDFNLDGLIDLIVVNRNGPAQIWRNTSTDAGNWLQISLHQPGPNTDAIGAWIEVRLGEHTLRREITVGGGHGSGQLGWHHFGLGASAQAEVRVIWPDGTSGDWEMLAANGFNRLAPGAPAETWQAP